MKIDTLSNFGKKVIYNDYYFKRISFADNKVARLLEGVGSEHENYVIDVLNSINNQDIEAIYFDKFQYKHRGNVLGFSKLSKAEGVFLLASVADLLQKEIWLHTDITQMTRSTLKKFIKHFYESPYVNIIFDSELSRSFYAVMVREALNG